ncbi:hypothetical protein [Rhizobium leguminosarum]|uniref:hypothetical protein n=1 Tax=Rhizobium leguminosarum TaxID=384 RepID=UPI002E0F03B5|nr:hypothetical protein U8Q02_39290 [Rhizobium leguminosarum]
MTRKITTSYAIYEPDHEGEPSERGWTDEDGVEFDTVLEAAVWLSDAGAVHSSSSVPSANIWFDSEVYEDPRTGRMSESSFHPSGFTEREIATLFEVVSRMTRLGHPDSLDYCWADDWNEFAAKLTIDDQGTIVDASDGSLVGMPAAAAYVERFGVDAGAVAWGAGPDGAEYVSLSSNDAVFFSTLDRPILVQRDAEGARTYSLETTAYLNFNADAPRLI